MGGKTCLKDVEEKVQNERNVHFPFMVSLASSLTGYYMYFCVHVLGNFALFLFVIVPDEG